MMTITESARRIAAPLFVVVLFAIAAEAFSGIAPPRARANGRPSSPLFVLRLTPEHDENYARSFSVIDACASSGMPSDDLYESVRDIDRNATRLYPDETAKTELWDRAHGSWKLQLATGGGRSTTFKSVPIFAYAMIDDRCFGNGVGFNEDSIILSLLGPHYFNTRTRQMGIGIEDVYLFANEVTRNVPSLLVNGMGLGKTPADYKEEKKRMPTFTIIGASEKSLIARGGTGGIAIWTRLDKDIRPAAYKMIS